MSNDGIHGEPRSWHVKESDAEAAAARLQGEIERLKERVRVLGAKALGHTDEERREQR